VARKSLQEIGNLDCLNINFNIYIERENPTMMFCKAQKCCVFCALFLI
jgi:hypothetical protein